MEISRVLFGYDRIEKADEGGMNSRFLHVGNTMDPYEFKVPKLLDDWVDTDPKHSKE